MLLSCVSRSGLWWLPAELLVLLTRIVCNCASEQHCGFLQMLMLIAQSWEVAASTSPGVHVVVRLRVAGVWW